MHHLRGYTSNFPEKGFCLQVTEEAIELDNGGGGDFIKPQQTSSAIEKKQHQQREEREMLSYVLFIALQHLIFSILHLNLKG